MTVLKMLGSSVAAAAMLVSAMPVQAQSWHGRYHDRHRRGDRVDGGDVLLGALLAGGLIALVASASDSHRDAPPPPPPPPQPDDGYADGAPMAPPPAETGPGGYRLAPDNRDAPGPDYGAVAPSPAARTEDQAVDRCVVEAEAEGRRFASISHVKHVTSVDERGSGWFVQGSIELRSGYSDSRSDEHAFRCDLTPGATPRVAIDGVS